MVRVRVCASGSNISISVVSACAHDAYERYGEKGEGVQLLVVGGDANMAEEKEDARRGDLRFESLLSCCLRVDGRIDTYSDQGGETLTKFHNLV